MNGNTAMNVVLLVESALLCALFLFLPRISRRGLLFGVYVGEEASSGTAARELRDAWTRRGAVALTAALAGSALALWRFPPPWSALSASLLPVAVFLGLYIRFHYRAREIRGPYREPPVAAATLTTVSSGATHVPVLVLAACVGMALALFAYTVDAWPRLPERIPTHFGASGLPDAWARKSVASVFLVPILGLVMALILGGTTWLVSVAKRAVRADDGGRSARAQERFRGTMTGYMAGIALITQSMLLVLGIRSLEVGLGEREGLGPITWVFLVALLGWTFGGLGVLMFRMGQGGSRLEGDGSAPLTDGLADDRFWKAGLIYVNRDDPSILVERRFGLGYTVNLGNPWGVVFLVLVLAAPLAILLVALLASP
jgi:uncharacterized membrane protein